MSLAEALFRTGCLLVAWILAYGHGVVLAVIPAVDCARAGDAWLAGLVVGVPAASVPLLLSQAGPLRSSLRWLAAPYLGLVLLALRPALEGLARATLSGGSLCPEAAATPLGGSAFWQRAWAPLQIALLLWLGVTAVRLLRNRSGAEASES